MLEYGSNNSLPAKYRIALALSTAFLIHTVLLSGVPSIVRDSPVKHREQLNLELVAADSPQSAAASISDESPSKKSLFHNPPFKAEPMNTNPKPIEPSLLTHQSPQKAPVSESSQAAPAKQTLDSPQPTPITTPTSTPSKPGARNQMAEKPTAEEVTKVTQSPAEQDPYLIKLAMHLATKLETSRIPAIRKLTETSTMELELQLLGNGALTRARVLKSTGIEPIDRAAYQAALLASPYPVPPPAQNNKSRFKVKLVFAPSRL
jgi:protein TonB